MYRVSLIAVLGALLVPSGASAQTWHGPQVIAPPGAYAADAAIADGGSAVTYVDGSAVVVSARPRGGVFGPAEVLSANGFNPKVGMAADGTTIVTWAEAQTNTSFVIRAAIRPPGGTFGPSETLGTDVSANPRLAVDAQGDAVALWADQQGLVAARRRPGAGFEGALPLGAGDIHHASLGIDGTGNVLAVWERFVTFGGGGFGAGEFHIEGADLRRAAAGWGAVDTLFTGDGQLPHLEVGGDGTALVTMVGASPLRWLARAPAGAWTGPAQLTTADRGVAYTVAGDGRAHVAWVDDATGEVRRRIREADGSLGAAEAIGNAEPGSADMSLGVLADGSELAVWHLVAPFGSQADNPVRAVLRTAGGALVSDTLAAPAGGTPRELQTAIAPGGHAVVLGTTGDSRLVAWVRDDAWPQEPDRTPPAAAPPVQQPPRTTPPADRTAPVVAASARRRISRSATRIRVRLVGDEACTMTLSARIDPRGPGATIALRRLVKALQPRRPLVVSLPVPARARRALARARGGVVRVRLAATDAAGNRSATRTLKLGVR